MGWGERIQSMNLPPHHKFYSYMEALYCSSFVHEIYLSMTVPIYLSIYLSLSVYIYLSIYLSILVCLYLYIYLSESFIWTTEVDCSISIDHVLVQLLSYSKYSSLVLLVGWKLLMSAIIWRLQVQSQQQVKLANNIYNNLTLVPGHG